MGVAALKLKIMPEQGINLEKLKKEIELSLKKAGAINFTFEEQEIAFGLKSLIVTIAWPESSETEKAEEAIRKINGVSSLDVIDYRRAFG